MHAIVRKNLTILLIEHKMDLVMSVSDRITVMHFGSVLAEGAPAEIQGNPEVRRAYLGTVGAMASLKEITNSQIRACEEMPACAVGEASPRRHAPG